MTDHPSTFIAPAPPATSAKSSSERLRSNSYEINTTKRVRAGSISGRLRAASDLEESGFIDKHQKGLIKDLIISGDVTLQHMLDKYERGERQELLDLIQAGYLGKQNVDILDGLDFDFLNNFPMDDLSGDEHGHMGLPSDMDPVGVPHTKTAPVVHHAAHGMHRVPSGDERHRRESIDSLYMQDLLHDDFHVFHHSSHSHDSAEHEGIDANVFGQIFDHFKEEGDRKAVRKSIRLEEGDVDLSAYATLAASLAKKGSTPAAAGSFAKPATAATASAVAGAGMSAHVAGLRSNGAAGGLATTAATSSSSVLRSNPSPSTSSTLLSTSSKPVYYTASGQELVLPADAKALGYVGAYSPEQRKERILKFLEKRQRRVWTKKVKYDVRKNFADSRMRIKGRFVKKEDEDIMRELMAI